MNQTKTEKLIFLLGSRYPAEKAYSISIGRTAQAIRRINNHSVEIWCQHSDKPDEYNNPIRVSSKRSITNLFWRLNNVKFTSAGYIIGCLLLTQQFTKNYKKDLFSSNVITREIYQALFLILKGHKKTILEIHHLPKSRVSKVILRFLFRRVKAIVVLYASQKTSLINKGCPNRTIDVLPMGVPDEFFVDEDVQKNPNEIVYLGRSHSSGVDSNLGLVLSTLRFMKSLRTREIVFKSIGVSKKDLNAFWNLSQRSHQMDSGLRLEIIPNVEHTEIPKLLRTSAIGLVPYTSEGYNLERFPIKVLEYAASRTLIVASEGYKMNDLLNEERAIFFESNSTQSLAEALQRALGEDNLQRVSAAQEWARNYTYSVRAFKVLKILENET